jgi:hypothetical protein
MRKPFKLGPRHHTPRERAPTPTFTLHALEPRLHLSHAPAAAPSAPAHALTLADRRQLLARLAPGPLTASLNRALKYSGPDAFDATLLKYMVYRPGPYFYFNGPQLDRIIAYARHNYLSGVPQATTRADAVLGRQFPEQINSTTYTVQLPATGDVDWDSAPRGATDNPDFLHTLNRHTFWEELGKAYQLTGDGKYVRELVAELTSWSDQTPPLANADDWESSSPHWWLLDAADRASNWTMSYFLVLGSPDWTPAANTLFLERLWDHGDFLDRAAPSTYRSNKTAIQAQGLQRVGMMFPEFADAPRWEEDGTDMTFRCLAAQFYADGGHVEETPAYQAAAADAFLDNYRLAQLNGRTYWTKNRRRILENAVQSYYQLAGSGLSDTYRTSNPTPFLDRAAMILTGGRYNGARNLDNALLLDTEGFYPGPTVNFYPQNLPAFAMPDSGYYVMRPGDGGGLRVIADAGPKGGEHGHYDLLSFEAVSPTFGAILPDPGPYRYDDSADRAYAVSTPAHNTISVDGLNHAAVEGAGNPQVVVDAFDRTFTVDSGGHSTGETRLTAHHHAYEYLLGRPTVGRTLYVDQTISLPPTLITIDWGRSDAGGPAHTFTTSFNLNATGTITQPAPGVVDQTLTKYYSLRTQSLLAPGQATALTDTFVSNSPPPNAKSPARRYAVSQTGTHALFVTLYTVYVSHWNKAPEHQGENPPPPAQIAWADGAPPAPGHPVKLRLTLGDGTVRLLTFNPPDLTPLPAAPAARPPSPFNANPVSHHTSILDEP